MHQPIDILFIGMFFKTKMIKVLNSYKDSLPNMHFGTRKKKIMLGEITLLEDFGTIPKAKT